MSPAWSGQGHKKAEKKNQGNTKLFPLFLILFIFFLVALKMRGALGLHEIQVHNISTRLSEIGIIRRPLFVFFPCLFFCQSIHTPSDFLQRIIERERFSTKE
ncbi:hypothetical protein J3F84DRAFT_389661 [Trichoderma pleuroticola]